MNTQRRGEETRAHILRIAEECFSQQGYDATGVAEICRRAGLSKGAFYHHFSSKQAVFGELLDRWLSGLDRQLATAHMEGSTIPDALLSIARRVRLVFQAADGKLPMFLEFWTKAARDPVVWQATIAPHQRYQAFFRDMVDAGIVQGTLRSVDPVVAAQAIVSLGVGLLLQGLLDPHGADWGQTAEEGMKMLLNWTLDK